MSTSSNHTKGFVQCCHGKHTVASSRTLLFDNVRSAYIYIQIYIHTHTHKYIHTHTHTYINTHTYMYTYTHTHTHTHIHTYILSTDPYVWNKSSINKYTKLQCEILQTFYKNIINHLHT